MSRYSTRSMIASERQCPMWNTQGCCVLTRFVLSFAQGSQGLPWPKPHIWSEAGSASRQNRSQPDATHVMVGDPGKPPAAHCWPRCPCRAFLPNRRQRALQLSISICGVKAPAGDNLTPNPPQGSTLNEEQSGFSPMGATILSSFISPVTTTWPEMTALGLDARISKSNLST